MNGESGNNVFRTAAIMSCYVGFKSFAASQ